MKIWTYDTACPEPEFSPGWAAAPHAFTTRDGAVLALAADLVADTMVFWSDDMDPEEHPDVLYGEGWRNERPDGDGYHEPSGLKYRIREMELVA